MLDLASKRVLDVVPPKPIFRTLHKTIESNLLFFFSAMGILSPDGLQHDRRRCIALDLQKRLWKQGTARPLDRGHFPALNSIKIFFFLLNF